MAKKFEPSKLSPSAKTPAAKPASSAKPAVFQEEVSHQVRQAAALKQLFANLESHLQSSSSPPLPRWVGEKVKKVAVDASLISAYLSALDRRSSK